MDKRIRALTYDSNQVYRLQGVVGYEIDLQFEPGERFVGLGTGDIAGLAFVAQDNHLFLKPRARHVATNLTVLTSRRAYQFEYTVAAGGDDPMYAIRFFYPPPPQDAHDSTERLLQESAHSRASNDDYWYCGSVAIKPTSASDDGVHTRLRFAAGAEQPAIFVRSEDGSESLLNFSMDADEVIIHRIAKELILRRGKLTGLVVNKSYRGSGIRTESGTVSSRVTRAVRRILDER